MKITRIYANSMKSRVLKSFGSIGEVFTGCIAQDILGGCEDRGFYWRPTQSFFYLLTYQVSAAPWAFHLANLIFFWVAGVLVYELARLLGVLSAVSLPLLARLAFCASPAPPFPFFFFFVFYFFFSCF